MKKNQTSPPRTSKPFPISIPPFLKIWQRLLSFGVFASIVCSFAGCASKSSMRGDRPAQEVARTSPKKDAKKKAPSGRKAKVEEADLYRIQGQKLYYLHTYRGLTIFDLKNRKTPKKIAYLPVFGYPLEMYMEKGLAYILIRDTLVLKQHAGKFSFTRKNTSQLISIDIRDPKEPKILQRFDISGQLRAGVSRKIGSTLYVVSYRPRWYYRYYGRGYGVQSTTNKPQVSVYSFNLTNPKQIQKIQRLDLMKKGPALLPKKTGARNSFYNVAISATANTLLIGESWRYSWYSRSFWSSASEYYPFTVMKVVDISDPKGKIRLHTRFRVRGSLGDQFKQTYIYNAKKKQGLYLGIFQRSNRKWGFWSSTRTIQNTLVSVDITDGNKPKLLDWLKFGKPRETVRGSLFDPERGVVYAITAIQRDPLYALSFKNPKKLRILSAVDGLSGDMNLFRFADAKKRFLVAVGRDNSATCTGFGKDTARRSSKVAVSLIDVRHLKKVRLVQRDCVKLKNAAWTSSHANWNRDQAHKIIGLHREGNTSLITVPVTYWQKNGKYWWYRRKSAVGLMKWDLSKYDPSKDEKNQKVLENLATIHHPFGRVERTVIFKLPQGTSKKRTVLNLSANHFSMVDLEDVYKPKYLSSFEISRPTQMLYRFGQHVVEIVQRNLSYGWYNSYLDYRIRKIGKDGRLNTQPVASFQTGPVQRVLRWKNFLAVFSYLRRKNPRNQSPYYRYHYDKTRLIVYDMKDPSHPKKVGANTFPLSRYSLPMHQTACNLPGKTVYRSQPRYRFHSGSTPWLSTQTGLVSLSRKYRYGGKYHTNIHFLSLKDPKTPTHKTLTIDSGYHSGLLPWRKDRFFVVTKKNGGIKQFQLSLVTYQQGQWKVQTHYNMDTEPLYVISSPQGPQLITYQNSNGTIGLYDFGKTLVPTKVYTARTSYYIRDTYLDGHTFYFLGTKGNNKEYHLGAWKVGKRGFTKLATHRLHSIQPRLMCVQNKRMVMSIRGGLMLVDIQDIQKPQLLHVRRNQNFWSYYGYQSGHVALTYNRAFLSAGPFGTYSLPIPATRPLMPISNTSKIVPTQRRPLIAVPSTKVRPKARKRTARTQ